MAPIQLNLPSGFPTIGHVVGAGLVATAIHRFVLEQFFPQVHELIRWAESLSLTWVLGKGLAVWGVLSCPPSLWVLSALLVGNAIKYAYDHTTIEGLADAGAAAAGQVFPALFDHNLAPPELSPAELQAKNLREHKIHHFIRFAIEEDHPERVTRLIDFLLEAPVFQDVTKKAVLLVYLHEQILESIENSKKYQYIHSALDERLNQEITNRKAQLDGFIRTVTNAIAQNDSLYPDVASVIASHLPDVQAAQAVKTFAIFDGGLINKLCNSENERLRAIGKAQANVPESVGMNEYFQQYLDHQPDKYFRNIDFTPLIQELDLP